MADMEAIKGDIKEVFDRMGFGDAVTDITAYQGVTSRIAVRLSGDASMLIGERGANLAALEHMLRKIVQKRHGAETRFTLDLNDYRMRRMEDLKQDVKAAAKEVRLYRRPVPLRPMSSFERRVVHLLLEEYPDITTESEGQDEERRVVIKPYP